MIRSMLACAILTLGTCGAALSQTTLHYREGQRVAPEDVREILQNGDASAPRTRSIRLLADAADGAAAPPSAPTGLSLPVRFEFDSATILPQAREQLDALAAGIKLLSPDRQVFIEGHTDATGTHDYNQSLSQRRAAAVRSYLVERHGIPARRLRDSGFGKRQPIDAADPFAAENRRVEFRGG